VLFAGTDERLRAIAEAFDAAPAAGPLEALRRMAEHVLAASDDMAGPDRLAVMFARPELQAQALQRLIAAQRLIAERLRQAYPDRLDDTLSRAVAGALVGALVGAVLGGIEQGDSPPGLRERVRRALTLLEDGLRTMLEPYKKLAMQYSPRNAIMYVSLVDAGTIEVLRDMGKTIVSSADLVSRFEAVLTPEQIASHYEAQRHIDEKHPVPTQKARKDPTQDDSRTKANARDRSDNP